MCRLGIPQVSQVTTQLVSYSEICSQTCYIYLLALESLKAQNIFSLFGHIHLSALYFSRSVAMESCPSLLLLKYLCYWNIFDAKASKDEWWAMSVLWPANIQNRRRQHRMFSSLHSWIDIASLSIFPTQRSSSWSHVCVLTCECPKLTASSVMFVSVCSCADIPPFWLFLTQKLKITGRKTHVRFLSCEYPKFTSRTPYVVLLTLTLAFCLWASMSFLHTFVFPPLIFNLSPLYTPSSQDLKISKTVDQHPYLSSCVWGLKSNMECHMFLCSAPTYIWALWILSRTQSYCWWLAFFFLPLLCAIHLFSKNLQLRIANHHGDARCIFFWSQRPQT